jgi:hypothetical protein
MLGRPRSMNKLFVLIDMDSRVVGQVEKETGKQNSARVL